MGGGGGELLVEREGGKRTIKQWIEGGKERI